VNTKICLIGYPSNKYSKFLLLSLKNFATKKERHVAMQELFMKKREVKKWTSIRDIENNGYSDGRLKKERKDE
jgi:hypothetical protein